MRRLLLPISLFAMTCAVAGEPDKPQPPWEKCGVMHEKGGKLEVTVLPSLKVFEATSREEFMLPEDAPPRVKAVQCGRNSIVPERNDDKIILAGFPFFIR